MMSESMSYKRHPAHKALYDALVVSLSTTPSKSSKTNKSVQADEIIKEPVQEMAKDDEEPAEDEVVNDDKHPHDDAATGQDRSKWFKQSPRPETPDPDWHKEPNADYGP
ncbi:hypothetical protein Tco_0949436 [Tanacetum coccineum]